MRGNEEGMKSPKLFGKRTGALLFACALVSVVTGMLAFGTPHRALAQSGPPGPGWVPTPGGGWVPPDHPLAGGGGVPANPGTCGLHTLRGSYIFAASGYNIVAGVPQPKAIVEPIDFNGDGTLVVPAATVSINGNISRSAGGVGVYTLDGECRGTVTLAGPSFDIFIEPTGKQGWMIQTNPNTVFQGTITRLSP
jgi:hypothetical protein